MKQREAHTHTQIVDMGKGTGEDGVCSAGSVCCSPSTICKFCHHRDRVGEKAQKPNGVCACPNVCVCGTFSNPTAKAMSM